MKDGLNPFAFYGCDAPYVTTVEEHGQRGKVVPVRPKTPFAMARRGSIVHRENGIAALFASSGVRFGGRFLCGSASRDVILLPDADANPCAVCEDIAKGPCVYRCFNAGGVLIYIGSTDKFLRRTGSHGTQSPWWRTEVADIKVERYPTLFEARIAETLAIDAEKPLYNRVCHVQRGRRSAA